MTDIRVLHKMVWQLREQIGDSWPTPSPGDCLRYAFTEAGEAMDAWLRCERPDDARNHHKPVTVVNVKKELADCAMMLLSVLGPTWNDGAMRRTWEDQWRPPIEVVDLDGICTEVGNLLWCPTSFGVVYVVKMIVVYPDMNLEEELARRLAKIRNKHIACMEVKRG